MKKIIVLQISTLIIVSGSLGGFFIFTDIYDEIQSSIVSVLCLSCLKLEPKTQTAFTFELVSGQQNPRFILDNLSKGVVFLHYSEDACYGCDIMLPIIQELFNLSYGKEDIVYRDSVNFQDTNIVYFYINLDHTTETLKNSFPIYDKDNIKGLPMFVIITLGYEKGIIKPYYTTLYGTLGFDNDEERMKFLHDLMDEGIEIYNQNKEGYQPG